jgi:hypothetical protein|tara:strand:+ start:1038 stop:1166 length:129 start_codon:yes stop_codon:yes gene_type:complete
MGLRGVILRGMIAEDLKISDGQLACEEEHPVSSTVSPLGEFC